MSMRTLLIAALAASALTPIAAEARDRSARHAADKLSDPALQASVATTMAAISAAMLDLRVGSFARALDAIEGEDSPRDLPPDATLGDLAGPDAQRLPYEISRQVPRTMGSMADMADAVDDVIPQIEAIGRRMERALPQH